jgi:hypothetical protein
LIDIRVFWKGARACDRGIDRRTLLSASPAIAAKAEGKKRV